MTNKIHLLFGGLLSVLTLNLSASPSEDLEALDKTLNATYSSTRKSFEEDAGLVDNLKKAQRLWLDFVEAHIECSYPLGEGENPREIYGSVYFDEIALLKIELFKSRIKQLRALDQGNSEVVDTPTNVPDFDSEYPYEAIKQFLKFEADSFRIQSIGEFGSGYSSTVFQFKGTELKPEWAPVSEMDKLNHSLEALCKFRVPSVSREGWFLLMDKDNVTAEEEEMFNWELWDDKSDGYIRVCRFGGDNPRYGVDFIRERPNEKQGFGEPPTVLSVYNLIEPSSFVDKKR